MKKAIICVFLSAVCAVTAFADEAAPDMDMRTVSSMRALSDTVLPWIGVAIGLSLLAILIILLINSQNHKS